MMIFAGALIFSHTSCHRSDKEKMEAETAEPKEKKVVPIVAEKAPEKVPEKKENVIAPLSNMARQRVGRMGALVLVPGQPARSGVLLEGVRRDSSSLNYLVLCDVPDDLASVGIACMGGGGVVKAFAKRVSTLPSGLAIFSFTSQASLMCSRVTDPVPGETFHAIQLQGEGESSPEEVATLTAELETIRNQIKERTGQRMADMRGGAGADRMRPTVDPRMRQDAMFRDHAAHRAEAAALAVRQSEIDARLKIPVASVVAIEMAAASGRDAMEKAGEMENCFLATSSGAIRSIRFKGAWMDIQEVIASSADTIQSVKLDLSGGSDSVFLSCNLTPTLPFGGNSYSMVAVTTFELESQGAGSLEERLAGVKPVTFQAGSGSLTATRQIAWNGRKTKLWLKVFNDKDPQKLILDEVILLDYPRSFSARWGKPPSPLITLPAAGPDMPEDLVKERLAVEAKGEICDIVAAGDGSVVMVQTNQSPYWAPFDLKSGQWMSPPWKATAATLVATQAGKVYLIDRETKILEVWGMASGKREGMQLLPLQGRITAVAAPLSDSSQPVMVTTEQGGYFLDPDRFEVIPSNLDLRRFFKSETNERQDQRPLDPDSLSVRASDDGSLYSFSGTFDSGTQKSTYHSIFTVDRTAMVVTMSNMNQFLATRGRNLLRGFPDHGGSAISVNATSSGGRFPGSPGVIRFTGENGREGFATMNTPPVIPNPPEQPNEYLVSDRGIYLDTSQQVLLFPDGDKLHLVRVNLPKMEKMPPQFLFAGESFEIPLPAGTGHKLVSEKGGQSEIGPTSVRWTAPIPKNSDSNFVIKLEWTGELGSQISKSYPFRVWQTSEFPEVVSPGGGKSIPLRRRCVLNKVTSSIVGFAGSGSVVMVNDSGSLNAWNLVTGEFIFAVKGYFNRVLGDADRVHLLGSNGSLTSYDLQTGEEVQRAEMGSRINSIATGISSRDSLLAVEQEGVEGYLTQVQRDGLKSNILDLPKETRSRLFMPHLASNASGSATWTRGVAIFRDRRAITVKPFSQEFAGVLHNGVPDASGRFIVGSDAILNIGAEPPSLFKTSTLPGIATSSKCLLEESGRYVLLPMGEASSREKYVSLREVAEPTKELMRIRYASGSGNQVPYLISSTNSLILWQNISGNSMAVVYDLDVGALAKELSR